MLKSLRSIFPPRAQTVLGHRIPEPRPTWVAAFWILLVLGVPVFLLGSLVDLALQVATGLCTGFWCW